LVEEGDMRGLSRNMHAVIAWQDMRVALTAEDVSWSPDVAADMVNRLHELWHDTLLELHRFGMLANDLDDDEADEAELASERELQEPHIVKLEDGEDG
jgi:hypothetical protein